MKKRLIFLLDWFCSLVLLILSLPLLYALDWFCFLVLLILSLPLLYAVAAAFVRAMLDR